MTNLVLVRHGETTWHADNRYAGSTDIGLTSHGYEQAELLAGWARTARLDAIWVSPLSRTLETAAPPARATGLTLRIDDRLRELDFGQAEGRSHAEMERLFPDAMAAFRDNPVAHHLPGGEDPRDAAERAVACFEEIARDYPNGRVLVVMHTTLIRLTLCQLIGLPLEAYRSVFPFVRNAALTEIRLDGDRAALLEFNTPIASSTAPVTTRTAEPEATS